jgi:uncharacterized SAM-binding protein YcdF (DUF218 family)
MFQFWEVEEKVPLEPDCLIVPSYALRDRHLPTAMTRSQIETAVSYQRRFPTAKIIFSTGDTQGLGLPDSAVMAAYARDLGLPEAAIIEEDQSRNTYENLLFSRRIVDQMGFKQPTLVLFDLHARRVLAIARKMGWQELFWLTSHSSAEGAHGVKRLRTFSRPAILLYELLGVVYSWAKGWL